MKYNTQRNNAPFDETTIEAVWKKAKTVAGKPDYARDCCGCLIYRHSYGKISDYGWEVDHIRPLAKDGNDELRNLQPLHWENNRHKSDNYPDWTCKRKKTT